MAATVLATAASLSNATSLGLTLMTVPSVNAAQLAFSTVGGTLASGATGGNIVSISYPSNSTAPNARGVLAVDFQQYRTAANHVASNVGSVISGGGSNISSGVLSTVAGGSTGNASGDYSTISGGNTNDASAIYSTVPGGWRAAATRHGQQSHASGAFSVNGDAQDSEFVLRNTTSNATPTELFLDGSSLRLTIPVAGVMAFEAHISGAKSDGSAGSYFIRQGLIKQVSGTTSLIGTIQTIGTDIESNAGTDVAITADDTNDSLKIAVTGIAAENWRWVARVKAIELKYV